VLFRSGIVNDQVARITEVMESISHCCGVIEKQDGTTGEVVIKKRKIYDTTIEKAKELCDTFKKFKPIDNEISSKLSEVVVKLENALNGVDTKSIRESDAVRDKVKSEVDDILSKFKF
jgi:type III secretion system FlhB-like substrate exporter